MSSSKEVGIGSMKTFREHVGRLLCPSNHFPPQTFQSSVVVHEPVTFARHIFARPSTPA